jgi:alpha,alpha-trehalase
MNKTVSSLGQLTPSTIQAKDYSDCLKHISKYWRKITFYHPEDKYIHLGLPNKFVSPNDGIYKYDQFYWDSYFIIIGLVRCGRTELAKGMIDNFLFLQKRFNIIPMRNRFYNLGSSQIPFLTSMAREVFNETNDIPWMKTVMKAAEHELNTYWMNKSLTEIHIVYKGLSRYCDHYITDLAAEHESGWDMTSRFHSHCLDYLPIDLNCALYKYETDLAEFYKSINSHKKHKQYLLQSEKRRRMINKLMWNFDKGFYFDYDYKHERQSPFYSIAGFYPMWAKLATHTQARRLVDNLVHFEYDGGLANTQSTGLSEEFRQHDYPNGWPHQQWVVIKGLVNYGYHREGERIAKKFLDLSNKVFKKTGKMWEKYNVVEGDMGKPDRYPTQFGFAWTNSVFYRLISKFESLQH